MFAAICWLTNSSLTMDVFRFETLDFDVSRPLTTPVSPSTTAIVTAEHGLQTREDVWLLSDLLLSLHFLEFSQVLVD